MTAPATLSCPDCLSALSWQDRFCGTCGARVARLRLAADDLPIGDLAVPPAIWLLNEGAVPVTVTLGPPEPGQPAPPPWLRLPSPAIERVVPPGESCAIPLTILADVLRADDPALVGATQYSLRLQSDRDYADPALHLRLHLLGRSALLPELVELPALPLGRGPIPLPFALHNGGGQPLEVERIEVLTEEGIPVLLPRGRPPTVPAGQTLPLGLSLPPLDRPDLLGRLLRLRVRCVHPSAAGLAPTEGELRLRLCRPPRLTVHGGPALVRVSGGERFEAELRNEGDFPIEVRALRSAAPWLSVEPLEGLLLPPGAVQRVSWTVHPERREGNELAEARIQAELCVETIPPLDPPLRRLIAVETEPIHSLDEAVLGIDFGTTGCAICLLHPDAPAPLPLSLEWEPARGRDLASLMFYLGAPETPFVYGQRARARAATDPHNLVRALKRALSLQPDRVWHFAHGEAESRRLVQYGAAELAHALLAELLRRAERAWRELPRDQRPVDAVAVRFRRAVFTHPVEAPTSLNAVLFAAARAAGLDGGATSVEEFGRFGLIDESSAALLHYLTLRAEEEADGVEGSGLAGEKVLCLDVGGGTTDITAAETGDPAAFTLDIRIRATAGDGRLGGEDLDRAIARAALPLFLTTAPDLRIDLLDEALGEVDPRGLLSRLPGLSAAQAEAAAHRVHGAALSLLEQAERAKIELGGASGPDSLTLRLGTEAPHGQDAAPGARPVEVSLHQSAVALAYGDCATRVLDLLDRAVDTAGWRWTSVDTLLLTGQTTRSALLRGLLLDAVRARRGELPHVVDADRFDPKGCVAAGAARFGLARGQVRVIRPDGLPATLELRHPLTGRWISIEGLQQGRPLPARARLPARPTPYTLNLYAGRRLFGTVHVASLPFSADVELLYDEDHTVWLTWDGHRQLPVTLLPLSSAPSPAAPAAESKQP